MTDTAKSLFRMPFGKYKGMDVEDIDDREYLTWLCEQGWFEKKQPDGLKAIETELKFREKWGK